MAGGAPTAAAVRRRTNGSPAAKYGNGATNGNHKNGKTGKTAPRRRGLVIAGVAIITVLLRGLNTPGAAIYGKNNKATAALLRSAKAFRGAKRRGPLTGVDAEALLQASQALIPAFDSYGPLLSRAARADLTGNVRKLRKAGMGPGVRDVGTVVLDDPDYTHVHGPTMALFWLNRILQQVAATFEELLKTDAADVVKSATKAYLRTTAPYNLAWQRRVGKLLLKVTPNRENLIRCYGQPDFAHLAPVFEQWLKDSRATREAIDEFYRQRPSIAPKVRWKGKSLGN